VAQLDLQQRTSTDGEYRLLTLFEVGLSAEMGLTARLPHGSLDLNHSFA